ncbi:hypothetical protein FRC06_007004, partial [Ceratobasidium sp. 370]
MSNSTYNNDNNQGTPQLKSLVGANLVHPLTIHILAVALTYANTPGEDPLKDPVQDMEHIRTKLSIFACVLFTTLYESAATRRNILNSLRDKLSVCRPGDLFVLYLAGHAYSNVGYEFVTYYAHKSEQAEARLGYREILEYVQEYCPSGVQVLQVRDTCFASPSPEEMQMLLGKNGCVVVLAACGVDQVSRLVSAAEVLTAQILAAHPQDPTALITTFFRTILSPVRVPGYPQQDPQLVPRQSESE